MNTGEWMIKHGLHKWIIEAEERIHGPRCWECGELIDGDDAHEDDDGHKYHVECCPDCENECEAQS